tara:strand:- start:1635 stop:1991 length:357 start_codon:yes stop_codon:yes gene_type:complete
MLRVTVLLVILAAFFLPSATTIAQQNHPCSADVLLRAPGLLKHHLPDLGSASSHGFSIKKQVSQLAPIKNPAESKQRFDVLEAWAFVYKAKYRLRFYYARLSGECVLMGQEVLEYARL